MTDRRKAILVEAARDLAEMQEGSDAGWGLWYDWLDTVVRKVEREAGEEYEVGELRYTPQPTATHQERTIHLPVVWLDWSHKPGDRVRVTRVKGEA